MAAEETLSRRTLKNVTSGTLSGVAGCLVGHPMDTLKVRLQTQPVHKPLYSSLRDCFVKTLKWEGIGGLYKGVGSPLVGQMLFRATLFTSYYQVGSMLAGPQRQGERLGTSEHYICGAITGFIAAFVEGPIDLFKTKMQIQIIRVKSGAGVQYRHVFHAGANIIRQHGIVGMYQGLPAVWLRNVPAFGLGLGSYEACRDYLTPDGGTVADLSNSALFLSGAVSGITYWLPVYPCDVIKSALQSDTSEVAGRRYRGVMDCAQQLYREGGWRRFYRGLTPCLIRAVPVGASILFVLEKSRLFLDKI